MAAVRLASVAAATGVGPPAGQIAERQAGGRHQRQAEKQHPLLAHVGNEQALGDGFESAGIDLDSGGAASVGVGREQAVAHQGLGGDTDEDGLMGEAGRERWVVQKACERHSGDGHTGRNIADAHHPAIVGAPGGNRYAGHFHVAGLESALPLQGHGRAAAQPEGFQGEGPSPVVAGVFLERNGPRDGVVVIRFGVDVSNGGGAARERFGIFPAHRVVHQQGGKHQVGSVAEGVGEGLVGAGIFAPVGENHVNGDGGGTSGRHQPQGVGQRLTDAHAAESCQRGFVHRQDGGLRLPRFRLVPAEHLVVGCVVHLRAKKPVASEPCGDKCRRQQPGIRRRAFPAPPFHTEWPDNFSIRASAGHKPLPRGASGARPPSRRWESLGPGARSTAPSGGRASQARRAPHGEARPRRSAPRACGPPKAMKTQMGRRVFRQLFAASSGECLMARERATKGK
jgi:hypothetical protein